jgi:hypothetical protein
MLWRNLSLNELRPSHPIALHVIHPDVLKDSPGSFIFDMLGDRFQAHGLADLMNRFDDSAMAAIGIDIPHK